MQIGKFFIVLFFLIHSVNVFCQKTTSKVNGKPPTSNSLTNPINSEVEYIIADFIKIDPNPFEDFIKIEILEMGTGAVEINILSIVGKTVRNFEFPAQDRYILNLSDLEKGIYLLKINNGKSSCVKRIIHQ